MKTRFVLRASNQMRLSLGSRYFHRASNLSQHQANPIGEYYASILSSSSSSSKPQAAQSLRTNTQPTESPAVSAPLAEPSILFSSRLSSPLERRSEIQRKSVLIAGVWVPPRPEEPDNCCMSGCVNCVWDRYRDELEDWAAARKEADMALKREATLEGGRKRRKRTDMADKNQNIEENLDNTLAISVDDDGGGSETSWGLATNLDLDPSSVDLFKDIPIGIREFMKQEKRLREKHARGRATT